MFFAGRVWVRGDVGILEILSGIVSEDISSIGELDQSGVYFRAARHDLKILLN